MLNNHGITAEEIQWKKKRNRFILYTALFVITIVVSAAVTFLVNRL